MWLSLLSPSWLNQTVNDGFDGVVFRAAQYSAIVGPADTPSPLYADWLTRYQSARGVPNGTPFTQSAVGAYEAMMVIARAVKGLLESDPDFALEVRCLC